MNRTLAAPPASCTATSSPVVRTPAQAVTGTLAYSAAEITSHTIITRRAGQRSTHAPAGSPMTSQGSHAAAVSTPTVNVLACSTMTATSGTPDHGHGVAELADRLAGPQQPEVALPQQPAEPPRPDTCPAHPP